jgi:membrane protein required for colicin V production
MLSILDFVILGIIIFSGIVSIFRGFIREVLSIITWIVAFWVAWHFSQALAAMLTPYIQNHMLRYPVAFIALFAMTMILGGLLNYLLGQLVDSTGLSSTDRTLGLLFGLLRGILIVGVMLLVMRLTPAPREPWWQDAHLVPVFMPLEAWLQNFLPKDQQSNFVMRQDS